MIRNYNGHSPRIHPTAYISEQALVIGNVTVGAGASLWPGCVVRGDIEEILIGEDTNLQDGVMVHTSRRYPVSIGQGVTVGHGAIIHSCTIGNNTLIGMGAIVMDRAVIGENCLVGAGSVVTEGETVLPGNLVIGSPARVKRQLEPEEIEKITRSAQEYKAFAATHAKR